MRWAWLAVIIAAMGCSKSSGPTGTITGTIKVAGAPVTGGSITFIPTTPDGVPLSFPIGKDGTYTATDVPLNIAMGVGIATIPPPSAMPDGGATVIKQRAGMVGADPTKMSEAELQEMLRKATLEAGPQVPPELNDPMNSGLSYTLTGPTGTFDHDAKK